MTTAPASRPVHTRQPPPGRVLASGRPSNEQRRCVLGANRSVPGRRSLLRRCSPIARSAERRTTRHVGSAEHDWKRVANAPSHRQPGRYLRDRQGPNGTVHLQGRVCKRRGLCSVGLRQQYNGFRGGTRHKPPHLSEVEQDENGNRSGNKRTSIKNCFRDKG